MSCRRSLDLVSDRDRGRAGPGGPRRHRGVRGLERRGGRRLLGGGPPDGRVVRARRRHDRPRRVLRLPGQPALRRRRLHRLPPDPVARHPDRGGLAPGPRPRRHPDPRHRAQHALAPVLRRAAGGLRRPRRQPRGDARRPPGRHPAHPADPGHRDRLRARAGGPAQARAVDLRGADRHRRGVPGRLHPPRHPGRLLLGRRAPLRRPAAVPQGDAGAARPAGGPARVQHPARRPARGLPGLGARRRRARRGGRGRRRLRPVARGDPGHRGPARGVRRGDRAGVREVPEAARDED